MTYASRLVSIHRRPAAQVVAAPQRADILTGAFRSAFGLADDLPAEFRSILAKLDTNIGVR
jgi:hypothetical protein